ncbi:hypothetical protein Tsubulata_040272 [Turnera subulata]|uniref:Demeter RRM-fold domain-containing protein n=1 Tax=Turnera subulata TaxID=218843 RepID=A0A9Q0FXW5_9ROSI|nr:hypothetical protein Tsubulata_040272 [Turnera subulata]
MQDPRTSVTTLHHSECSKPTESETSISTPLSKQSLKRPNDDEDGSKRTPKKIKRKRHRPKVLIDVELKKLPKQKSKSTTEKPKQKRKYVRKNISSKTESQSSIIDPPKAQESFATKDGHEISITTSTSNEDYSRVVTKLEVKGDKRYKEWNGSVLDSIVGVFLTQNVQDYLSSKVYMKLVARFPKEIEEPAIINGPEFVRSNTMPYFVTDPECDLEKPNDSILMKYNASKDISDLSGSDLTSMVAKPVTEKMIREVKRKMKNNQVEVPKSHWDSLRKKYSRPRSRNQSDSVDWDAVRQVPLDEFAKLIQDRGQHFQIGGKIQEFLNDLHKQHGNLDLEWLRYAPPEDVKLYLMMVNGLGPKSVECIRLLALKHVAFPVDTNVGRIAVRLGWVPLQTLPGDLQFHLLEDAKLSLTWPSSKADPIPSENNVVSSTCKPNILLANNVLASKPTMRMEEPYIEFPNSPEPGYEHDIEDIPQYVEHDIEDIPPCLSHGLEILGSDDVPIVRLVDESMTGKDDDSCRALVQFSSENSAPFLNRKLKYRNNLRTEHQVFTEVKLAGNLFFLLYGHQVFADDETSYKPLIVRRSTLWNLDKRMVYFGNTVTSIYRASDKEDIESMSWNGYICVKGFDCKTKEPKDLSLRFHCPPGLDVKKRRPRAKKVKKMKEDGDKKT